MNYQKCFGVQICTTLQRSGERGKEIKSLKASFLRRKVTSQGFVE